MSIELDQPVPGDSLRDGFDTDAGGKMGGPALIPCTVERGTRKVVVRDGWGNMAWKYPHFFATHRSADQP
jgi:hypothetical protein